MSDNTKSGHAPCFGHYKGSLLCWVVCIHEYLQIECWRETFDSDTLELEASE